MAARTVRTDIPGVYSRGSRYVVTWRDANGKQRWKSTSTIDAAIALKQEKAAIRDQVAADLLVLARGARARAKADMSDVYQHIRRATQSLDRARGINTQQQHQALTALYRAEDIVAHVIRGAS